MLRTYQPKKLHRKKEHETLRKKAEKIFIFLVKRAIINNIN